MDDKQIVELFWERSEDAIAETDRKYGRYILFIAKNVLSDDEDAREVQNDTYLQTWNSIPPERPTALRAYVGAICRNLALSRYRRKYAEKRQGCVDTAIEELADCLPDGNDSDRVASERIGDALNRFLEGLEPNERKVIVLRYWYMCSIDRIAEECSMNKNTVATVLFRKRRELKAFLEKEGVNI